MLQFYFLSIVINALAGYIHLTGDDEGVLEFKGRFSLKDETSKFVLGILSVLTGVFKVLSPIEGDVPVLGDLLPAATGILAGLILIFEYYKNRSSLDDSEQTEKIGYVLMANKKIIGVACLVAAILHFLFPKVLLL
jgi:hypothetical protein